MHIFLETDRLILRQFTENDVDNLLELNSDSDVVRFTPDKQVDRAVIQTQLLPKLLTHYKEIH